MPNIFYGILHIILSLLVIIILVLFPLSGEDFFLTLVLLCGLLLHKWNIGLSLQFMIRNKW